MNHPTPRPDTGGGHGLPPSPWILLDRTTAQQTLTVLSRLEQWLASADPDATDSCARTCSHGEDDAVSVAGWVGTLAAHLNRRIHAADSPPLPGRHDDRHDDRQDKPWS